MTRFRKKDFFKTYSLVDEILSWPRVKLRNFYTSTLDGVETGLFAQQLRRRMAVSYSCNILLDVVLTPNLILSGKPEPKKEEAASLSKYGCQKSQRYYTQGGAAYRSLRCLVRTSNLPVSRVRQNLHSKSSCTKFALATGDFKRLKIFATFKNEIWFMALAYGDN